MQLYQPITKKKRLRVSLGQRFSDFCSFRPSSLPSEAGSSRHPVGGCLARKVVAKMAVRMQVHDKVPLVTRAQKQNMVAYSQAYTSDWFVFLLRARDDFLWCWCLAKLTHLYNYS